MRGENLTVNATQRRVVPNPLTYEDVQDKRNDAGRHHAQHGLPPVPAAVDKHQAHVLEVAHGSREELHEGVSQPVAGQHLHRILLDGGDAPVEGLPKTKQERGGSD